MTLKLIVENDRNELNVHDFDGNYIAAGRSSNNDLVLNERNVSRHHFQLEIVDNRIIIEDRGSYNKTFVNDREISEKMEIFVGDVISIGDYNIYLEQDEDSALKTASTAKSSKKTALDNLLLAKSGYIGGKTSFAEFSTAERYLVDLRLEMHEAQRDANRAVLALAAVRGHF